LPVYEPSTLIGEDSLTHHEDSSAARVAMILSHMSAYVAQMATLNVNG